MSRSRHVRRPRSRVVGARAAAVVLLGVATAGTAAGCGGGAATADPGSSQTAPAALVREARPIGRGPGFQLPPRGRVAGPCRRGLGARAAAHVELFARNRVLLIPAGIGARPPLRRFEGRIDAALCFGPLVTVAPTGVVLVPGGTAPTLAALFAAWGQPLTAQRLGPFRAAAGTGVRVYVDGQRVTTPPWAVRLRRHAEIVLEVGSYVPPHASYRFPPGS